MKSKFLPICRSFLLGLILKISLTYAAQAEGKGGITGPNYSTCYYQGTTSVADAFLALTANKVDYAFLQLPVIRNILAVFSINVVGASGVKVDIFGNALFGYAIQIRNRVFFLNLVACRDLVLVANTRDLVYGYPFLYGYQLYQAFAAVNTNVQIPCSTVPSANIIASPAQATPIQGFGVVGVGEIQSFMVFNYGCSLTSLQSNIIRTLQYNNVSATTTIGDGFVSVYNALSVTVPCVFRPADVTPNDSLANVVNNQQNDYSNGARRRIICDYVIRLAEELSKIQETSFTNFRSVLPLTDGKIIIISAYTLRDLFDGAYAPLLAVC